MTNKNRWFIWVPVIILCSCASAGLTPESNPETRQFDLAWKAYESGQYGQAVHIWTALAEQGHPLAQINLGAMYDQGLGVQENPATAFEFFHHAALSGNPYAQFNLGNMYVEGRGVRRDTVQAEYWYRKAADQGLASAQFRLGLLLAMSASQNNRLTGGDREAAIKWIYKSGLSYLKEDNLKGACSAHQKIKELADGHPLEARLGSKIHRRQQKPHSKALDESFEGASFGTGWPIASGHVITNNHVVTDSDDVLLVDSAGQQIKAQAILRDEVNDIAVLEVGDVSKLPPALPLATSEIQLGARVFTIGFPRIDVLGKTPKLTRGIISKLKGPKNEGTSCQTTVPIQPGNSGGPLINMKGEVVGVIRSMLGLKNPETGETYILKDASCALKINHIAGLLTFLDHNDAVIHTLPRREASLDALERRMQDSLLIVVVR